MTYFDNINTSAFERILQQEQPIMDVKSITTLVLIITICLAFLATVVAPFVGVVIPAQTLNVVYTIFVGLIGAGGALGLQNIATTQAIKAANAEPKK